MPTIKAQQLYAYQDQGDGQRTLIATAADASGIPSMTNNIVYWDANGNPVLIFTPSVGAVRPRMASSRDYAFFMDGVSKDLQKWHVINGLSAWGSNSPLVAPVVGAPINSGSITLITGRKYAVAFYNPTTASYTDISPISASTGALTNQNSPLSAIPVSSDPQMTQKLLLATADGGNPATLYEVASLANATTTYTDATPELTLVNNTIWQETDSNGNLHGLIGNQPPPNGLYPTYNNGRMFLAVGETLYFSKSLADVTTSSGVVAGRYEECWIPDYSTAVSTGAEQIKGLLSDGQTLYIGTELHIRRITGDGPSNFSEPQIIFPQTGLLNQNTWQVVFVEGQPVGTMWLTPDFRVMFSDFNTYAEVGTPILSYLQQMNPAATNAAFAVMVSNGPYNLYMLGIATGSNTAADTFLVYDLRRKKWYVWQFADPFLAGIYYVNLAGTPRWTFCDVNGVIRAVDSTTTYDRQGDPNQATITSTVQTTWLSLGDANARKALNQFEIETVDANLLFTLEGASTDVQFVTPNAVLTNVPLVQSVLGPFVVPAAASAAVDRFYRMKFVSTSGASSTPEDVLLGYVSVDLAPIHRL